MKDWKELTWWESGEQQVVQEKLDDLDKQGTLWCPGSDNLYKPFRDFPPSYFRVVFVGQDPYPNPDFATGLAFSIPADLDVRKYPFSKFPPTLLNIFDEYEKDLHLSIPAKGDLSQWVKQGVLLLNTIPSCTAWHSMSHDWWEYTYLIKELVEKLSQQGCVFVFFGSIAGHYSRYVDETVSRVILVSHPSPRASQRSHHPFLGSRVFSRVNEKLCELKKPIINWRL